MSSKTEVRVPDIGDFQDVEVIEVLVKAGDTVSAEDPLITLETDKASMDVPSTGTGQVLEVAVATGDRVSEGSLVVVLAAAGDAPAEAASSPVDAPTPAPQAPAEAPAAAPPAPAAPAAGGGGIIEVRVPDIGDFTDVEIIEVHVASGDAVDAEAPLITLETDKASMDVPAPEAGTVGDLAVNTGDKVSEGDVILTLAAAGGAPAPAEAPAPSAPATTPAPPPAAKPPAAPAPSPAASIDEAAFRKAHAGPSVRRFARELGVDLGRVTGTGLKGRITRSDVKAYVKSALSGAATAAAPGAATLPAVPVVDFAKFGEVDVQPLTRVQRISGPRLHASWVNLPHVTQFDEADITELMALRKKMKPWAGDVKLTPLAFIVVACVKALQEFPRFNTSLDAAGESLVYKKYFHIGFAADTPNGLVVPVVRDADKMTVLDVARALADLSAKAREGKLKADDMQGGSFTISSLGGIGGTMFTPIINAPEVAILGASRSYMKPVWNEGGFEPRLMLPLSLSYDHRVIDGADGARFTRFLAGVLENPSGMSGVE